MSEVITTVSDKKIDVFIDSLIRATNLHPSAIANKFSKFCGLMPPLEYANIVDACYAFGVDKIDSEGLPDNLRGFHTDYDNNIHICLRPFEWEGGISHTLLHELFEIIINRLNKKIAAPYEMSEYMANLFAASVLMPEWAFLEFALRANMDLQLIREKYYQSYFSLLLRFNWLLRKRDMFYIGFLAENKLARKYNWRGARPCNEFKNFEITDTTIDRKEHFHDYQSLIDWLYVCHGTLMAQESEDKTTVYLSDNNLIIRASPILNHKNCTIRSIGIQIMKKEDYQKLFKEIFKQ